MATIALPWRTTRRTRRRTPARANARAHRGIADLRRWNAAFLAVLVAATIGYLALANGNAAAGYELRSLEHRADVLREEARQLELASLSAQSMDQLAAKVAERGFVPVARVEFIDAVDHAVVAR